MPAPDAGRHAARPLGASCCRASFRGQMVGRASRRALVAGRRARRCPGPRRPQRPPSFRKRDARPGRRRCFATRLLEPVGRAQEGARNPDESPERKAVRERPGAAERGRDERSARKQRDRARRARGEGVRQARQVDEAPGRRADGRRAAPCEDPGEASALRGRARGRGRSSVAGVLHRKGEGLSGRRRRTSGRRRG